MTQADIVMEMTSGTEVSIVLAEDGVVVETLSQQLAESWKMAVEELRKEISPSDGDPIYAMAQKLAERFNAFVIYVTAAKTPVLADGQEVVH
jgi:cobalamin biosynthesis protein CobD/CbiB